MKSYSSFANSVIIVSLGPLIASLFAIIAEPFIARYWRPEVFGMVSYYNSLITIISPALFLRYNYAIVQRSDNREEINLLVLSLFVLSLLLLVFFLFFSFFASLFDSEFPISEYKLLFFLALFFASQNILFRFWVSSKKRFVTMSVATIILQVSFTLLLLIYGSLGKNDVNTIVWIRTISYVLCPLGMILSFIRYDFIKAFPLISLISILSVAKKYWKYPLIEFWGFILSLISYNIPILLTARYWGQETNGLFSKAFFLLYMVVLFTGESISRVLHKEIADMLGKKEEISQFLLNTVHKLAYITILPFTIILLVGPEVFSLFLGPVWIKSGIIAQNISVWMYVMVISISVLPLYPLLNKQQMFTFFQILTVLLRVAMLGWLGVNKVDFNISILHFSLLNAVILITQTFYILKVGRVGYLEVVEVLLMPIVQVLPLVIIFISLQYIFTFNALFKIILLCILAIPNVYYFYLKKAKVFSFVKGNSRLR